MTLQQNKQMETTSTEMHKKIVKEDIGCINTASEDVPGQFAVTPF